MTMSRVHRVGDFVEGLKSTASKIYSDEAVLKEENQHIVKLLSESSDIYKKLLKCLWVIHRQRLRGSTTGRRMLGSDKTLKCSLLPEFTDVTFNELFMGSTRNVCVDLLKHLKEDRSVFCSLLCTFHADVHIVERLCHFAFTTLGNFGLSPKDAYFLDSTIHALLLLLQVRRSQPSPADDVVFSTAFKVFYGWNSNVRRFSLALTHELVSEISFILYSPDGNDNVEDSCYRLRSALCFGDVRPSRISSEQFCSLVNCLIRSFSDHLPIFPHAFLLLLGRYRHILNTSEGSENGKLRRSLEFIVNLYFVRTLFQSASFWTFVGHHLDPSGRSLLQQIFSAFNFLVLTNGSAPVNKIQPNSLSTDFDVRPETLLSNCDTVSLRAVLQELLDRADRTVENSQNESVLHDRTAGSSWNVQANPFDNGNISDSAFSSPLLAAPPVVLTTPTDLNVLIDCIRIFAQGNPTVSEKLKTLLERLPEQLPGSLLRVFKRPVTKRSARSTFKSRVAAEVQAELYQLVYFGEGSPLLSSLTVLNPSSAESANERSRSTSRIDAGPVESNTHGRNDSYSSSLSRVNPCERSPKQWKSVLKSSSNVPLREIVHIISLTGHPQSFSFRTLTEQEFSKCNSTSRISAASTNENCCGPKLETDEISNAPTGLLQLAPNPCLSLSQSQSGSGLSRSSTSTENHSLSKGRDDNGDYGAGNEGEHYSRSISFHSHRRYTSSSRRAIILNEHFTPGGSHNGNVPVEEDISNDRASDVSERSGCTSLASSAHALGRLMRSSVPVANLEGRSLEAPGCQQSYSVCSRKPAHVDLNVTTAPGSTTVMATEVVEKRTRFSLSDCGPSIVASSHGTQLINKQRRNGRLPRDNILNRSIGRQNQDVSFARSRLVRTGSAELLRCSHSNPLHSHCGTVVSVSDRNILDIASNVSSQQHFSTSTNSVRCSSLNSLQTSGFESHSVCGMELTSSGCDSVRTADIQEADERSSVRTCSSCGGHLDHVDGEVRNLRLNSQPNGDNSSLVVRPDEEDALSDLPLSSANVSGRVTPLSLASSTSRGAAGVQNTSQLIGEQNGNRAGVYGRAGLVLPNGVIGLPRVTVTTNGIRAGFSDFSPAALPRHGSLDVTDKFGKFDLPPIRMPELEARSTVSDTWSTDVLASDTEYTDAGPDVLGTETVNEVNNHRDHQRRHHRRRHRCDLYPTVQASSSHHEHRGRNHADFSQLELNPANSESSLSVETSAPGQHQEVEFVKTTKCRVTTTTEQPVRTGRNVPFPLSNVTLPSATRNEPLTSSRRTECCGSPKVALTVVTEATVMADGSDRPVSPAVTSMKGQNGPTLSTDRPLLSTPIPVVRLADGMYSFKEGYSRLKEMVNLRARFTLTRRNDEQPKGEVFPISAEHEDLKQDARTMGSPTVYNGGVPVGPSDSSPTDATHDALSVPPVTALLPSLLTSSSRVCGPGTEVPGSLQSTVDEVHVNHRQSKHSTMRNTAEESVEEMMARYRLQSAILRAEQRFHSSECFFCVRSFCQTVAFASPARTSVDSFHSEAGQTRQTGLTSIICETERLFRLLVNSVANGLSSIGGSVPRNPIAPDLIRHLCKERTYRRPYFNYILKSAEHSSEFKRYLSILNLRLQRDLLLQCDFILHKAVTTFLDSQLDAFQHFYAKIIQERENTEMVDTPDPAPALVAHFVDKLLHRWSALSSGDLLLVPLNDPDFDYLSETSTMLSARLHIERMVMEKLYRSGIWMNDARVERERDRVLHRELAILNASVTMSDLQIPEHYHVLEPFQSAQDELRKLDRSHVPVEIIQCLKRVMECIVATLTLITPNSAPSADELLPVLIYVIIQVNPPRLLTNLAFIEAFGGVFDGEDQYIWCQFRAAVAEVRRMLSLIPSDQDCRTSKVTYRMG
ncbi:hypothetical protein AHF37_00477 [Paragonimus kellicotti]|nr:hypothetical protein AHF37_00477 [Paragonimus kellicotti]